MVIPTFMAGWASNNKFALLGGMRAIAQSVSYGVPLVLAVLVPGHPRRARSASRASSQWQAQHHWIAVWPIIPGLPAFVLFFMAMLAESNRIPFDIPEAESELVAGVTTEYTGVKFTLFYMAEYVHTLVGSAVGAALFLGGWDGPFAPGLALDGRQDAAALRVGLLGALVARCASAPISSWRSAGSGSRRSASPSCSSRPRGCSSCREDR